MSLCFLPASSHLHSNKITEESYLTHLLAHYLKDVSHPKDKVKVKKDPVLARALSKLEIWTQSIRHYAVETKYDRLDSTSELEEIFQACLKNDLGGLGETYEKFTSTEEGKQVPILRPLAALATSKGYAQILGFCFEQGVTADKYLKLAIGNSFDLSVEMLETLRTANYQNIQTSTRVLTEMARTCITRSPSSPNIMEVLDWLLEHGAKLPAQTIRIVVSGEISTPSAPLVEKLLELDPNAASNNPRALAYAAGRGFTSIVEQILNTGIGVDDIPRDISDWDSIRDQPFPALYHAITGGAGKLEVSEGHIETVRLLLERGAKVDMPLGTRKSKRAKEDTPLIVAKRLMNKDIISMLEKFEERNVWATDQGEVEVEEGPKRKKRKSEVESLEQGTMRLARDIDDLW